MRLTRTPPPARMFQATIRIRDSAGASARRRPGANPGLRSLIARSRSATAPPGRRAWGVWGAISWPLTSEAIGSCGDRVELWPRVRRQAAEVQLGVVLDPPERDLQRLAVARLHR